MPRADRDTQPSSASDAAVTSAEAPAGVGEGEDREQIGLNTIETTVASLLARYPEAPVLATGADGLVVEMPPSVPLQRNPILRPKTGLELITAADRPRLIATWDQVLANGTARCPLHTAASPETAVMYCGFDLRHAHGVILAVVVPLDPADDNAPQIGEHAAVAPRFARVTKNDAGFIVAIDEALTRILGWESSEMEGHRSIEFIHSEDHALAIDNWLEMLASPGIGRRVRLRHRRRDGSWVWFEITNNNLLSDPDYRCVVCEMVDISEEMAREQLLERLAETVPVGLLQVDAARNVVYTNDQLHRIIGVQRASAVGAQLTSVIDADREALEQALDGVLTDGCDAEVEVEVRHPGSGGLRFCTVKMRALNHDGTIGGAIACVADVTDGTLMREELKRRATFDQLTGCYNRPAIMDALDARLAGGRRRSECAVMFLDLDHFKEVNDRDGHAAGDELLTLVAGRLTRAVRAGDLVGRIGGDEFLVVCPDIGGPDSALRLAERVAAALGEPAGEDAAGAARGVEASIGVAWTNEANLSADVLVARADRAMYESKRERTCRPKLASPPGRRLRGVA